MEKIHPKFVQFLSTIKKIFLPSSDYIHSRDFYFICHHLFALSPPPLHSLLAFGLFALSPFSPTATFNKKLLQIKEEGDILEPGLQRSRMKRHMQRKDALPTNEQSRRGGMMLLPKAQDKYPKNRR